MMWNRPFDTMPGLGDWGWFGPFHFIGPLLFWGLIIAAIVFVVRRTGHHRAGLEVLEQRYARGEIDREEYLQRKVDIAG